MSWIGLKPRRFSTTYYAFVDFLLPQFQEEGKTHLTLAIGCTGGQHRSVVIANVLGQHLSRDNYPFTLSHRDMPAFRRRTVMIGILIVTHQELAEALLSVWDLILGKQEGIGAVSLDPTPPLRFPVSRSSAA